MVRIYGVTASSGSGSGGANQGIVLRGSTTSDGTVYLTTNNAGSENSSNMCIIAENTTVLMNISVVARTDTTPFYAAGWLLSGMAKRGVNANTVSLMGISVATCTADSQLTALQIFVTENLTTGGISIQCKGINQYTTVNWIATIGLTQV